LELCPRRGSGVVGRHFTDKFGRRNTVARPVRPPPMPPPVPGPRPEPSPSPLPVPVPAPSPDPRPRVDSIEGVDSTTPAVGSLAAASGFAGTVTGSVGGGSWRVSSGFG
jgi:hypothetical protein